MEVAEGINLDIEGYILRSNVLFYRRGLGVLGGGRVEVRSFCAGAGVRGGLGGGQQSGRGKGLPHERGKERVKIVPYGIRTRVFTVKGWRPRPG